MPGKQEYWKHFKNFYFINFFLFLTINARAIFLFIIPVYFSISNLEKSLFIIHLVLIFLLTLEA